MHHSPDLIGLVGDCHSNLSFAKKAVRELASRGITEIHFLGDFGFLWEGKQAEWLALKALHLTLEEVGATGYVTGGNHEGYPAWFRRPIDDDGIRWAKKRIGLLPRGWRATTPTGKVIASLGGANSINKAFLLGRGGRGWFEDEQITDADLAALGTERVDVLLGHDAPTTRRLLHRLIPSEHRWDLAGRAYANAGRAMFHRGFLQVRPSMVFSGHYHQFIDTTEEFVGDDGVPFTSRSVVLNMEGHYPSLAALEVSTGSVEFIQFDQAPPRGWSTYDATPA